MSISIETSRHPEEEGKNSFDHPTEEKTAKEGEIHRVFEPELATTLVFIQDYLGRESSLSEGGKKYLTGTRCLLQSWINALYEHTKNPCVDLSDYLNISASEEYWSILLDHNNQSQVQAAIGILRKIGQSVDCSLDRLPVTYDQKQLWHLQWSGQLAEALQDFPEAARAKITHWAERILSGELHLIDDTKPAVTFSDEAQQVLREIKKMIESEVYQSSNKLNALLHFGREMATESGRMRRAHLLNLLERSLRIQQADVSEERKRYIKTGLNGKIRSFNFSKIDIGKLFSEFPDDERYRLEILLQVCQEEAPQTHLGPQMEQAVIRNWLQWLEKLKISAVTLPRGRVRSIVAHTSEILTDKPNELRQLRLLKQLKTILRMRLKTLQQQADK